MLFEEEIDSTHPMQSDDPSVDNYHKLAMELVGERYTKFEFIHLVRWLIMDEAKTAREKALVIK